jgi:hypothetical protein
MTQNAINLASQATRALTIGDWSRQDCEEFLDDLEKEFKKVNKELDTYPEKALKMVSGIKAKSYEERCKELGLDTLEKRRSIQDMVETFRILCSNNDGYASGILETVRTTGARTRQAAEPLNLVHKYARTEVRRNSFSVRVAEPWNKLSRETREAKNVQQFKRLLKNEWK